LFLAFSNILAKKKEEFAQNHTTILRDEYKIEDMMIIVKESLIGRDQLRLQDLFKEAQNVQEVITLFLATLELIKTQELILVQEESFGDIYLMEKKEESQVPQS
ncbi:TPA: segregation/condensation protein A, partial [Streptococcus pneumoniae]|nr:segregation/condensation protein A [Streptococcus pneumoniae]